MSATRREESMVEKLHDVREHYASLAQHWLDRYGPNAAAELQDYPAESFRLEIVKVRAAQLGARRLLDAGAGPGATLIELAAQQKTTEVAAFDITPEMVRLGKSEFSKAGLDPAKFFVGDVQEDAPFRTATSGGPFDVALCLGVLPHVTDDIAALARLRGALRSGGRAFCSFRNPLFDLFTFNRFTKAFILNELLNGIPEEIREVVSKDLDTRLRLDQPVARTSSLSGGVGYDMILATKHNPLSVDDRFRRAGFASTRLHFYHYHPCAPFLEAQGIGTAGFRSAAMALEGESSWRGYFLCSAFLVEATA